MALGAIFQRFSTWARLTASAVLACVLLLSAPAEANNRYASLVMNADTGDVIYTRNADSRRYPASLTKIMTLYLLFEAIEDGRLSLDDELHVSARAAGQPPSKLGVEEGSTISVGDAIQALVVRSANDVAVVVAEALGESEWGFSRIMTRRAHEMGMDQTRFENASGLPHSRQRTTARDLSILAVRMLRDFPQYQHYFSQESFTYNGRTWNSHNHLLEDYDGTTGMKTGYTRASGFNLIATVERDGISLIGIVMGGRTATRRDRDMVRILDLNFDRLREDPHFGSRVFASNVRPRLRPNRDGTAPARPTAEAMASAIGPSEGPELRPETGSLGVEMASLPAPEMHPNQVSILAAEDLRPQLNPFTEQMADAAVDAPEETPVEPALEPLGLDLMLQNDLDGVELAMNEPGPNDSFAALNSPFLDIQDQGSGAGLWGVSVGSFLSPEIADRRLQSVAASVPTLLTWGMAAIFMDNSEGTMEFDAGFGPLSEAQAADICASLTMQGFACETTEGQDWDMAIRR